LRRLKKFASLCRDRDDFTKNKKRRTQFLKIFVLLVADDWREEDMKAGRNEMDERGGECLYHFDGCRKIVHGAIYSCSW
jgi:hypothetical protein